MSIIVKNTTKLYGTQRALNNVSFEIPEGQVAGFLGPNGAGKSTMMKIITGFIPPTEGLVMVNGLDIFSEPIKVQRLIGYLPESNPLYTDMYVREFLNFISGVYGIKGKKRRQRIEELISLTGLEEESGKKISALSKGFRQRVGLLRRDVGEGRDPPVENDVGVLEVLFGALRETG